MTEAIGQLLPFAVGTALSPFPIIAIVLILATPRATVNGLAFLLGWIVGLTLVGGLILLVAGGADASEAGEPAMWVSLVKLALGALLLWFAVGQWRGRNVEKPAPKWMQAMDALKPGKALGLGVLLAAVNPKNLVLTAGAAAAIAGTGIPAGDQAVAFAVFVVVGSLGTGVPVGIYLALGERSKPLLDRVRSWMSANNTVIMAVLFLVIGAKLLGDGISGL
jgi:threonine/homoserine/homoserine lactone efflux protein